MDSDSSKYGFADGYYQSSLNSGKTAKYYVVTGSDSIKVYPSSINKTIADTVKSLTLLFSPHVKPAEYVTLNRLDYEYDGAVFTSGGALYLN